MLLSEPVVPESPDLSSPDPDAELVVVVVVVGVFVEMISMGKPSKWDWR